MAVLTGSLNPFSKLEKLKIQVYGKRERDRDVEKEFVLMFNPESYSLSYKNNFENESMQPIGSRGKNLNYISTNTSKLSLKLILDNTEVTGKKLRSFVGESTSFRQNIGDFVGRSSTTVQDVVKEFLNQTIVTKANKEPPKYLKLMWGGLEFNCMLSDVTINYTLFNRVGVPTRAELDTTFIEDEQVKVAVASGQNEASSETGSPDVLRGLIIKSSSSPKSK